MTLVSVSTSLVVLMLLASVVLGWVAELRRTGGAASAQERRDRAGRPGRPTFYTTSAERADAMRERLERERRRRERARSVRQRAAAGPARADRPPSAPPPPPETPEARHRATLGLDPGPVTEDALRSHYRRLVTAYHPDRVAGLGPKLQQLAEEETKAINEAYAFFKRHLGL